MREKNPHITAELINDFIEHLYWRANYWRKCRMHLIIRETRMMSPISILPRQ